MLADASTVQLQGWNGGSISLETLVLSPTKLHGVTQKKSINFHPLKPQNLRTYPVAHSRCIHGINIMVSHGLQNGWEKRTDFREVNREQEGAEAFRIHFCHEIYVCMYFFYFFYLINCMLHYNYVTLHAYCN
jgi:hypothetical protein